MTAPAGFLERISSNSVRETNTAVNTFATRPKNMVVAKPRMGPVPNWNRNAAAISDAMCVSRIVTKTRSKLADRQGDCVEDVAARAGVIRHHSAFERGVAGASVVNRGEVLHDRGFLGVRVVELDDGRVVAGLHRIDELVHRLLHRLERSVLDGLAHVHGEHDRDVAAAPGRWQFEGG